jgi:hypothetical protein
MLFSNHYRDAVRAMQGYTTDDIVVNDRQPTKRLRDMLEPIETYNARARYLRKLLGKLVYNRDYGMGRITEVSGNGDVKFEVAVTKAPYWCSSWDTSIRLFQNQHHAKRVYRVYLAALCNKIRAFRATEELVAIEHRNLHYDAALRKRNDRYARLEQGQLIAKAIAYYRKGKEIDADIVDDVVNALNNVRIGSEKRSRVFNKLNLQDYDRFVCPDCGYIDHTDEAHSTLNEDIICSSCIDNYYWSNHHETYIPSDDARPLYLSRNAYNRESADDWLSYDCDYSRYMYEDGAYFDEDTYYLLFENSEDEPDEDYDGLHDYHGAYRDFVEQWTDKRFIPLGVEIEVYSHDRYDVVSSLRDKFPELYLERDGSLDDDHGFEIITQPYGKTEWAEFAPRLLNHLLERKVLGYNHPDDNSYGIHISMNREYLSPLQEARMSLFLTAEENIGFVKAIAQRNAIYGGEASMHMGSLAKHDQTIRKCGGLDYNSRAGKKKINGMGKYSPLNLKHSIAECRIFQSTLHPQSFMKNLEFMWALAEWTSTKSATGSSWLHTDFVKWLAARPNVEVDYGYLTAYLRRPKYVVKRGRGAIANTWLENLPHITTKSQPTEDIIEEALAA